MRPTDLPDGPLLVDTDVFSHVAWRHGRHADWEPFLRDRLVAVSFATVGELWAGAIKADWGEPRRERLRAILDRYVVVPATADVTARWAELYARFQDQFEQNDMWTAACALAQPSPLPIAAGNLRHFEPIAKLTGLRLVHPDR